MFRRRRFRGLQQQQVPNENEASNRGRCAVDAIGECSLGRTMPNILRRVCRVSLVQHDMSMMRTNLLAGIAVLLMATLAAHAEDLDWGRLHTETVALYGECDFDVSIAGRERLRVISHCTKD